MHDTQFCHPDTTVREMLVLFDNLLLWHRPLFSIHLEPLDRWLYCALRYSTLQPKWRISTYPVIHHCFKPMQFTSCRSKDDFYSSPSYCIFLVSMRRMPNIVILGTRNSLWKLLFVSDQQCTVLVKVKPESVSPLGCCSQSTCVGTPYTHRKREISDLWLQAFYILFWIQAK